MDVFIRKNQFNTIEVIFVTESYSVRYKDYNFLYTDKPSENELSDFQKWLMIKNNEVIEVRESKMLDAFFLKLSGGGLFKIHTTMNTQEEIVEEIFYISSDCLGYKEEVKEYEISDVLKFKKM